MRESFGRGRRLLIALNVTLVVVLAVALWTGANLLATRPALKAVLDFSPNQRFSLSDASTKLLARLRNTPDVKVEIHTFYDFRSPQEDPVRINQRLIELTTDLLKQYANLGGDSVAVVHHNAADLFENREAFAKLGVHPARNVVVVNLGKRSRVLGIVQDLGDVDFPGGIGESPTGARRMPVLKGYQGEEAITSAMQSLLDEGNVVAYFLTAVQPLNSAEATGLAYLRGSLAGIGIDVRALELRHTGAVPADAAAVVVVDPLVELPDPDVQALNAYLDRGGRLVLSSSFLRGEEDPAFGDLAVRLGIRFSAKLLCAGVPDPANPELVAVGDEQCRLIRRADLNPQHPMTRELAARGAGVYLEYCRAIFTRPEASGVTVEWLILTDPSGFEENWAPGEPGARPPDYRPDGGKTGRFQAGVAVTRKDSEKPFKAIVLTGNPLANKYFTQNTELVLSAFRWLTDRTHLVSVPTKRYAAARLELTNRQIYRIRWLLVGILPGAIALLGIVVLWFRRRR